MFLLHGRAFFDDFFLKHHFGRFASGELQHVQPFWFYLPVVAGWLYPWPMVAAAGLIAAMRSRAAEGWAREMAWMAAFGFVFFSASTNKLPGYVLPLVPLVMTVAGHTFAQAGAEFTGRRRVMLWSGFLLFLIPVAATVLPEALLHGLTKVSWESVPWEYFAFALVAGSAAQWLDARGRPLAAAGLVAALVLGGVVYVKLSAFPVLDRVVSARWLARRVNAAGGKACVETLHRSLRYGLNYYVQPPLPDCEAHPSGLVIDQPRGGLPTLRRSE
jgi:4-amino-4-deoxy-L-arabinose transferase-like glycosyltransferase